MSTENQVHLIGTFRREEIIAAGTIKPGHLVEEDSSGTCVVHSSAGGVAQRFIAEIDALQDNTLDDDYSSGDLVSMNVELPGNEVQMYLKAGESVAIGEDLESAGDGTLQAYTSGIVIAQAREVKDLSASGAVDTLMRVILL